MFNLWQSWLRIYCVSRRRKEDTLGIYAAYERKKLAHRNFDRDVLADYLSDSPVGHSLRAMTFSVSYSRGSA